MASSYEADGRKSFTGCNKVIVNELNQQNLKYSICDWRKLNSRNVQYCERQDGKLIFLYL